MVDFYGKCRWIYHTWILWVTKLHCLHWFFPSSSILYDSMGDWIWCPFLDFPPGFSWAKLPLLTGLLEFGGLFCFLLLGKYDFKKTFRAKCLKTDDQGLFWCLYCLYWKNLTFISVLSRHKTQVLGSLESLDKCLEVSQHQCCSYWFGVPTCWTNKKHHGFQQNSPPVHSHQHPSPSYFEAWIISPQREVRWFCWKKWSDHIIISHQTWKKHGWIQKNTYLGIQCVFFKHIPSQQRHLGGQAFNNNEW